MFKILISLVNKTIGPLALANYFILKLKSCLYALIFHPQVKENGKLF